MVLQPISFSELKIVRDWSHAELGSLIQVRLPDTGESAIGMMCGISNSYDTTQYFLILTGDKAYSLFEVDKWITPAVLLDELVELKITLSAGTPVRSSDGSLQKLGVVFLLNKILCICAERDASTLVNIVLDGENKGRGSLVRGAQEITVVGNIKITEFPKLPSYPQTLAEAAS